MSKMVPAGDLNLNVVLYILDETVLREDGLREKLVESLTLAKAIAYKSLNRKTYQYFEFVFGKYAGWPTHIVDYMEYVKLYLTQVPYADRLKLDYIKKRILDAPHKYALQRKKGAYEIYTECVFNDLCHFYFLVNQKGADGTTLQQNDLFASWIKIFGMGQGVFLNTPKSLNAISLATFELDPMYNFSWYNEQKDEWKCFNDFFSREFNQADSNGFSPLRPITPGDGVITSPADCTFMHVYMIDENGKLLDSNGDPASYTLKGFSQGESVDELLSEECRPFWKYFYGGTFIHYFLSPYDYHRFHVPVDGTVVAMETITGQNYLNAVITDTGDFDAPDDAEDGYEFRQERGLIIVQNDNIGPVATLPIGMAQVSGVHMYKDQLLYRNVSKGQEFGYFLFGGSDIILVIPKPVNELDIVKLGPDNQPNYFHYGTKAVEWPKQN